jgi:hypothetical protein
MRTLILAAALTALVCQAAAQVTVPGLRTVPLGYCQLTSLATAAKLSDCSGGIPAGANLAYIEAEAQAVRYRDDGTAPTGTVGMPIASGGSILYAGTLSAVQVIEQTASAKLNVLFYRSP